MNPQGNPDDIGVGNATNGNATIVDADAKAITFARTPAQVLNILYGGGAFFPNSLNGNVK